ncbi:hypothetical protein GCM10011344_34090 [Dokdonia pacifica]|uniref:Subtilase family protein n=1 Tax=Dokdonia pacifica TaxID=1627892 RepID=A0A239BBY8_9FLAO|nr:S8 family serine peptidase [Dokdonia pacifica]GGG30338.1 hypothetical protein GCM10011344_34090 [Dokdonia pacifica]SNS05071.1 Subtilase family protein [Dokdonia pacifica]
MNKLFFLVALFFLCSITGCEKDDTIDNILDADTENTTANFVTTSSQFAIGKIVIKYVVGTNEAEKQVIRDLFQVTDYKKCTCADPTLEQWFFDLDDNGNILSSGISLETVAESSTSVPDVEGSQIDTYIKHDGSKLDDLFGSPDIALASNLLASSNSGVTIAVMDTGIDYNYFGFDAGFLYNSQLNTNVCSENGMTDYFGWDFVNSDNDPHDDHGHGTKAISMIYDELKAQNNNFQILPIKVFDVNGRASIFDILCGFKYATNNSDVDIINMSFGWYNTDYTLLKHFIEDSQDDVIIVTSAGNDTNDNDIIPHYLSSYDMHNILSVTSWNGSFYDFELSRFSNFGIESVDIAAPGENIPFFINENEYIMISGTSYAAAYAAAIAGKLYTPNITPDQHISTILSTTIPHDSLTSIKYGSYLYY